MAVVVGMSDVDTEAERQSVAAVIGSILVSIDSVLLRVRHSSPVLLPEVYGVRQRCYLALEDRLSSHRLRNTRVRQPNRRSNYDQND